MHNRHDRNLYHNVIAGLPPIKKDGVNLNHAAIVLGLSEQGKSVQNYVDWCTKIWVEHDGIVPDGMGVGEFKIKTMEQKNKLPDGVKFVIQAIVAIKGMKEPSGSIECPKCLGVLQFSKASNKHVRAKCQTDGCLSFME